MADRITVLSSDADGRCLIIGLKLDTDTCIKLVKVYFPCYSSKSDYKAELGHCLGFIENSVAISDKTVIMGDMNFECQENNAGYVMCNAVFSSLNISCCDNLCQAPQLSTYCNDALGCSSFIDHCFVSDSIRTCVSSVSIIDSGCNLSDHRPIAATFVFSDLRMDKGHKNSPSTALPYIVGGGINRIVTITMTALVSVWTMQLHLHTLFHVYLTVVVRIIQF